jgi:uncharacterized damage-inducible protein DinB
MTELQFLIDQLHRMYEGGAWHGPSLREALDGVSFELATKRLGQSSHSIFDLVHHMAAWIGEVHARLKGRSPQLPDNGDFPTRAGVPTEGDWNTVRQHLDTQHATLLADLEFLNPARLQDTIGASASGPLGTERPLLSVLHGLVQHNAYHIGQIVLIRRALGA